MDSEKKHLPAANIVDKYKDKKTRPLSFGELEIILIRFEQMLQLEPNRYTIQQFIEQEDFRRDLFKD